MSSQWNPQLAEYIKEFMFNAGLPILTLTITCLLYSVAKWKKLSKILVTLSFLFFFVFCFRFNPDILTSFLLNPTEKKLEKNYSSNKLETLINPPNCISHAEGIVVLGGGTMYTNTPADFAMARILGLIELLKFFEKNESWKKKKIPIVFSGGFTDNYLPFSEAKILEQTTKKYYPSNHHYILEEKSKNTYENSIFSKNIFEKNNYKKNIILITNTFHMNRAEKTFIKQGFEVCPVPVVGHLKGRGLLNFENAQKTVFLLNEYFGLLGYKLRGWI